VPAQVDRPQWLVHLDDDSLALLEQERWAAPLTDELRQALLEILRTRFGAIEARSLEPGAPSWRIRLDVSRFETRPYQTRIDATWSLQSTASRTPALRCASSLQESASGGMPALAQAHRRAVGRLASAIGSRLVALQRGEPGRCPD
jgi:uncharacterized lipoprotein YmbA